MRRISFAWSVYEIAQSALEPDVSEEDRVFAAAALVAVLPSLNKALSVPEMRTILCIVANVPPLKLRARELAAVLEKELRADAELKRVVDELVAKNAAARDAQMREYRAKAQAGAREP